MAVEETFQNDHRVVNTRGSPEGRFTFSAAESGDHRICFTPAHAGTNGGWLANGTPVGGIKLSLDLATGETSQIESTDKGKLSDIVQRVKDLNARLHDIRREQVFQRVRLSLRMMPWEGAKCTRDVEYANECVLYRNGKPSFEISPRRRMPGWSDGHSCNLWFWGLPVHGNSRIYGRFSSNKNSTS